MADGEAPPHRAFVPDLWLGVDIGAEAPDTHAHVYEHVTAKFRERWAVSR